MVESENLWCVIERDDEIIDVYSALSVVPVLVDWNSVHEPGYVQAKIDEIEKCRDMLPKAWTDKTLERLRGLLSTKPGTSPQSEVS